MKIKKIGVIGAGSIGVGVAQTFAEFGFEVILIDKSIFKLEEAKQIILENIRLYRLLNEKKRHTRTEIFNRITFSIDLNDLNEVDYLIENVTEEFDIKKKLYTILDKICSRDVIFAANTSTILISQIASFTKRPAQVIGLHFMNPVPLKAVVEIIRSKEASLEAIKTTRDLLKDIEKKGLIVTDSPGFVINRVLMPFINDAIRLVEENVASMEDIDLLFKGCLKHAMGPLETADLIGLDTVLHSLQYLQDYYQDVRFKPATLLQEKVERGDFGNKTGQGFYFHYGRKG